MPPSSPHCSRTLSSSSVVREEEEISFLTVYFSFPPPKDGPRPLLGLSSEERKGHGGVSLVGLIRSPGALCGSGAHRQLSLPEGFLVGPHVGPHWRLPSSGSLMWEMSLQRGSGSLSPPGFWPLHIDFHHLSRLSYWENSFQEVPRLPTFFDIYV